MRNVWVVMGLAFAITLAVVVGNRLSEEALAVVVGAICGITASLPVSVGLVIAASRNWGRPEQSRSEPEPPRAGLAPQPPVVVIAPPPPSPAQFPYSYPNAPYYGPHPTDDEQYPGRQFKIIGDEE